MATKAEMYREMADHATGNLTAQVTDWVKFLLMAGRFYKYQFLDIVMIYTQRSDAKACAGYDLWKQRMNRQVRYGSKGIALLRYRDGRVFLRYVFDVADTERRENSRDPVLWQYRDEYEGTVTSHLEECFKVPGGDGLAKQLITLAVRFAEDHWHDFKDSLMLAVHELFHPGGLRVYQRVRHPRYGPGPWQRRQRERQRDPAAGGARRQGVYVRQGDYPSRPGAAGSRTAAPRRRTGGGRGKARRRFCFHVRTRNAPCRRP